MRGRVTCLEHSVRLEPGGCDCPWLADRNGERESIGPVWFVHSKSMGVVDGRWLRDMVGVGGGGGYAGGRIDGGWSRTNFVATAKGAKELGPVEG